MSKKNAFTRAECEAFVDVANPHQWLLSAEGLHRQAIALWNTRGTGQLALKREGQPTLAWDFTSKSTYLLAAFAMENMLKAFLVYEYPEYVADGYLTGITSHDLPALADKSSLLPYRARDRWVYAELAAGNESWMRYPCGRNANDMQIEQQLSVKLWLKYCDVMQLYESKMERLLTKGWTGPYGFYGSWEFT